MEEVHSTRKAAIVPAACETWQCRNCPSALTRCCERARTRASSSRIPADVPARHAGTDLGRRDSAGPTRAGSVFPFGSPLDTPRLERPETISEDRGMHALTFFRFGGPEVLEWTAVPDPRPAPGIAVVSTHAIGLNFADIYRRQGRYHLAGSPPWIAGYEAAGEITALHPDKSSGAFRIGHRVAFADSAFANAERVAVPLDRLIALPDDIDFETAAALLLQGLTAQFLVEDSHTVHAGETVLVHAAGGGVGQLLLQLARSRSAHVIALASSEQKRHATIAAGATHAVDSRDGLVERVRELAPDGVDDVYDSSASPWPTALRWLALAAPSSSTAQQRADTLFAAVRVGHLRVTIAARFALRDGAQAHALLERRGVAGKVLLIP